MYRQEKIWGLRRMFKGFSGNENVYIPQTHRKYVRPDIKQSNVMSWLGTKLSLFAMAKRE